MDLKPLARDERADLAAFLETLTPEQWEAPSLCEGWRVRDVVAHMISYEDLGVRDLAGRLAKGRFTLNRTNAVGVADSGALTPDELLAMLRKRLQPTGPTAGFSGLIALTDGVIHHQDIRRPLGRSREIPAERLLLALRGALKSPLIGGFWRGRGVRLVATDLDWSRGSGPDVRGPAEALLMAIAGRRGIVQELSGPGRQKLADRVEKPPKNG
ncbi:maleylpyruvate isomerase family mycothiol-dependent enzyme [Actinomadura soli]|uniref:Maleylpyruvate isomerase family mycothiol-dependent enzyme n=1 Tax=Actinomadura soli TaxID=2508997 RepID=A0A5C4JL01_9ACTN|nr:maleylpyruvate isomerase family mycothiol-dependent enzyme [Actinomadura soli]TMR07425.1 maleylpyruvate isomerase family mycothiol-dependent enzyme [Actinomadura soli]